MVRRDGRGEQPELVLLMVKDCELHRDGRGIATRDRYAASGQRTRGAASRVVRQAAVNK